MLIRQHWVIQLWDSLPPNIPSNVLYMSWEFPKVRKTYMVFHFPPSNFYSQDAPKRSPWQKSILMQFGLPSGNKKMALLGTVYRKYERKFCRISQIFILQAHFKLSFLHKPPHNPDFTGEESLHYFTLKIQRFSGVPSPLSLYLRYLSWP